MSNNDSKLRNLSLEEIERLKAQGCTANDWNLISISSWLDLSNIVNVYFKGYVNIYKGVKIRNLPGGISGLTIKENVIIENVASIECEESSHFGAGTKVSVLDETGSRAVPIYPGLSSQIATLLAREPKLLQYNFKSSLKGFIDSRVTSAEIGENSIIKNCGSIKNVSIGAEITIDGASRLENGSIINNAAQGKSFTYIGNGVDAENFILEDGRLESKSHVYNCYIGQGAILGSGFAAHDSLFFANCEMENGEAHSLLAGPYTVSMHKGSLLIGCQTSFMNAGSGTNQSNHMYKMGPIHWGVLERGVKTSSGSYLMLGARIGAFSLLMGPHKNHPDTSDFPFSYLFGDDRGYTTIVPGLMLRSCGLLRDEKKWPLRDRRLNRKLPLIDHITFEVLNPSTVETLLNAIDNLDNLLSKPAEDDFYIRYKGLKITRAAAERAKSLYTLAISKYLYSVLHNLEFPENDGGRPDEWVDIGGQVITRRYLHMILNSETINEAQALFDEAFEKFKELELKWIGRRFGKYWRERKDEIKNNARRLDEIIEEDRQDYLDMLAHETDMLAL